MLNFEDVTMNRVDNFKDYNCGPDTDCGPYACSPYHDCGPFYNGCSPDICGPDLGSGNCGPDY